VFHPYISFLRSVFILDYYFFGIKNGILKEWKISKKVLFRCKQLILYYLNPSYEDDNSQIDLIMTVLDGWVSKNRDNRSICYVLFLALIDCSLKTICGIKTDDITESLLHDRVEKVISSNGYDIDEFYFQMETMSKSYIKSLFNKEQKGWSIDELYEMCALI
jgi:hypothetical protein